MRNAAALIVLVGLCFAQAWYAGTDAPDWQGYQALYDGSSDWLGPGVFTVFLGGARWLFGADGYGAFRLALFIVFGGFATGLAWTMPTQPRLGAASALMCAGAVLAAMGLKSIVQIREGLAFVVFLTGPVGAVAAASIHLGLAPLSAAWLFARAPWRVSAWLMSLVGLAAGLALATVAITHAEEVRAYAVSLGVDVTAPVEGGWLKIGYWVALGFAAWVLRARLRDGDRFDAVLASGLLPAAYGFCAALLGARFETPSVTSMGVRVLFTAMGLALLRVCQLGRADVATAIVALGMIGDELRLVAAG